MSVSPRRDTDGLTDFERAICHAVDRGLTNEEAYRAARPGTTAAPATAKKYAWRARSRPHCVAYLRRLRARSLARHLDAKEQIVGELAAIAFADIWDFVTEGPDGLTVRPLEDMPPDRRRAVSELALGRTAYGGTVRLKLHDKIRAFDKLCQMLGLHDPEYRAGSDRPPMSDVERAQRLAAILRLGDGRATLEGDGG